MPQIRVVKTVREAAGSFAGFSQEFEWSSTTAFWCFEFLCVLLSLYLFPLWWFLIISVLYIGNGYRMRRGEGNNFGGDDTPICRSARQAGLSPESMPPHPP